VRIVEPLEAWTPADRRLAPEHAAALAETGVVRVSPLGEPELWRLEPGSHIGVLVGDGWEVRIKPRRLNIPCLYFLLAYAFDREGWRNLEAEFETADDVVSALAAGFALHAEGALHRGILRGYVQVEEQRHDLRGRVRFADQLARVPGMALPLEVSYDDFVVDILENRLLRTAAEVLLRVLRLPGNVRTRLMRIRALLEDVTIVTDPRNAKAPLITRLNERYSAALALAELILRATSLNAERGDVSSASFVFDMNQVFEDFLTRALEDALRYRGGWLRPQFWTHLAEEDALPVRPDITWWCGGRCRAVVDAKYKAIANDVIPNGDAYQMLAYCIALGIPRGFLVYAKQSGEPAGDHVIRRHGYVVSVRSVDVELRPPDVLAQVGRLADEIVGDLPSVVVAA
jgi:5-methylcytosine-specific restriction enzyme subunit McrC